MFPERSVERPRLDVMTTPSKPYGNGLTSSPATSTLVIGPSSAVLIDAQASISDAKRVAETIRRSGKRLTHVWGRVAGQVLTCYECARCGSSRLAAPVRAQLTDVLRTAIAAGLFWPGDRLVERDLCARNGVSRTSIREVSDPSRVFGSHATLATLRF